MEEQENIPTTQESSLQRTKTINLADFLIDEDEENNEEEEVEDTSSNQPLFGSKTLITGSDTDVILCGYMKKKAYSKWQERYFQLKNGKLYWYKSETSRESSNNIDLKDIKKCTSHKDGKFLLEGGDKVYKFTVDNHQIWVDGINAEMRKLRTNDAIKKLEGIYDVKIKPKIITTENFELPNFNKEKFYMRKKVESDLLMEKFFPPKPRPVVM